MGRERCCRRSGCSSRLGSFGRRAGGPNSAQAAARSSQPLGRENLHHDARPSCCYALGALQRSPCEAWSSSRRGLPRAGRTRAHIRYKVFPLLALPGSLAGGARRERDVQPDSRPDRVDAVVDPRAVQPVVLRADDADERELSVGRGCARWVSDAAARGGEREEGRPTPSSPSRRASGRSTGAPPAPARALRHQPRHRRRPPSRPRCRPPPARPPHRRRRPRQSPTAARTRRLHSTPRRPRRRCSLLAGQTGRLRAPWPTVRAPGARGRSWWSGSEPRGVSGREPDNRSEARRHRASSRRRQTEGRT